MVANLVRTATQQPRIPLHRLEPPDEAGAYLQFLGTTTAEVVELLTPTIAAGTVPCYVGSASSLRERLGRYRQTIRDLPFEESDIHVALIPCASKASALYSEAALIDAFGVPVFNRLGGWGQKVPGRNRRRQRSSAIDALFPGRTWVTAASPVDRIRARATVVGALADLDPTGPRWSQLT
jgi:hypothetical protein